MTLLEARDKPKRLYEYYTIIPHAGTGGGTGRVQVLLVHEKGRWSLPHFEEDQMQYWQVVDHINGQMRERLGINLTTLRCLLLDFEASTNRARRVYEMENHSPTWVPPDNWRWVSHAELVDLEFVLPAHRTLLDRWFTEVERGQTPPLRVPWAQPGWYDKAAAWIDRRLQELGVPAVAPIEQERAWTRSAILRVGTTIGDLYFKALPPMFGHEPELTRTLADWFPANFPRLFAVDSERHWMLLEEFHGVSLSKVGNVARWEEALRTFASIQIACAGQVDHLVSLGCAYRPLSSLLGQMNQLFADRAALRLGHSPFSDDEIARLRALAPQLKDMCSELDAYGLPATLEHGDLWSENIIATPRGYIYFDWSDSCVTHPFFSTILFFRNTGVALPNTAGLRTRLRAAYLEPWSSYQPVEKLEEAFELAQALAPLHYALTYYLYILPGMESRWEMENMLTWYLRMLLKTEL